MRTGICKDVLQPRSPRHHRTEPFGVHVYTMPRVQRCQACGAQQCAGHATSCWHDRSNESTVQRCVRRLRPIGPATVAGQILDLDFRSDFCYSFQTIKLQDEGTMWIIHFASLRESSRWQKIGSPQKILTWLRCEHFKKNFHAAFRIIRSAFAFVLSLRRASR